MRKKKKSDVEMIIKTRELVKIPTPVLTPVITCDTSCVDKMIYQNPQSQLLKPGKALKVHCFFSVLSVRGMFYHSASW